MPTVRIHWAIITGIVTSKELLGAAYSQVKEFP